jgi:hypothetical protein
MTRICIRAFFQVFISLVATRRGGHPVAPAPQLELPYWMAGLSSKLNFSVGAASCREMIAAGTPLPQN